MEFSSTFVLVLVASIAALALLGNWLLWRQLKTLEEKIKVNTETIAKEGQVTLLSHISTDQKLQSIEQKVRRFTKVAVVASEISAPQPIETPKPITPMPVAAEPESVSSSINNASKLFKEGLEPDEVAKRCGLSRAEAELMALIHDKNKVAS